MPPVARHATAGRFRGLRTLAVPPVWLTSSATKSARQLITCVPRRPRPIRVTLAPDEVPDLE